MSTLVKLRKLFLPISIGSLVAFAAGSYNFAVLPSQHKYLDNRKN